VPVPEVSNGPHLSYAIQWFAFAVIAMVGSTIVFARGGERAPHVPPEVTVPPAGRGRPAAG
jgi:cytochrome oxidase assembly protein ShyY1